MLTVANATNCQYTITVLFERKIDNYTREENITLRSPDLQVKLKDPVLILNARIRLTDYYGKDYVIIMADHYGSPKTIEVVKLIIAEGEHGPLVTMAVDGTLLNPLTVEDITTERCCVGWLFCCPCMLFNILHESIKLDSYKTVEQ
jgi:hypothetical protein